MTPEVTAYLSVGVTRHEAPGRMATRRLGDMDGGVEWA
jgi:hypothetical protein